jgi:putative ABC transport system permease protein
MNELLQEVPLAWSQLSHQKVRFLVALSGISFANILIFMQLGFRAAMFDGVTRVQEHLKGDLFLVNSSSKFLGNQSFSRRELFRAAAVDGVASADLLYYTQTSWINPQTKELTDVTVIAFNPIRPLIDLPEVQQQLDLIKQPDTVLFDRKSLASLGPVAEMLAQDDTVETEVGGRKTQVGGLFSLGSSLFKRGHLVTSDWNYIRMFGKESVDNVQVGVLTLRSGADAATVLQAVRQMMPGDVKVLNREDFIESEQAYWSKQPAGIIFNFGTVMGFIVGVVIVYQVLYSDVNDHLPEYATLKAMGYSDGKLLGVVFQEAIVLGIFGFLPGFGCSIAMYGLLGHLTRIAVIMRPDVAIQVFILTLLMCLISAAIAIRKLQSADPADVF